MSGRALSALVFFGLSQVVHGQLCVPRWSDEFSAGAPLGEVRALAVYDADGAGPQPARLYAGDARGLWRWDGAAWANVGTAFAGCKVYALAVFDEDGAGPLPAKLYVGGDMFQVGSLQLAGLASYDGTTWANVGGGVSFTGIPSPGGPELVRALSVFDDGGGSGLYVAGGFDRAGTGVGQVAAKGVVLRRNGAWSELGSGMTSTYSSNKNVYALAVFDEDGSGTQPPRLFAAGGFTNAGGVSTVGIARWNGAVWSSVGQGMQFGDYGLALVVHDEGSGPRLVVGGKINQIGGAPAAHVARWDGGVWSGVGGGVNAQVSALHADGPTLFAGGVFTIAGGAPARAMAKFAGGAWSGLGPQSAATNTANIVYALRTFDDSSGPALAAGGNVAVIGGVGVSNIAKWNGAQWGAVGSERRGAVGSSYTARVLDTGDGPALYVAQWKAIGAMPVNGIAKWNGTQWSVLGPAPFDGNWVWDLAVFNDGSGPALYAAHDDYTPNWVGAVSKWTGSAWVRIPGDFRLAGSYGNLCRLIAHNDGSGTKLYVLGSFDHVGATLSNCAARWTGSAWEAVGTGMLGQVSGSGPSIRAGALLNGVLHVGGLFTSADGQPATGAAKWTGSQWVSEIGPPIGSLITIESFDSGTGPALVGNTTTSPNAAYQLNDGQWTAIGQQQCPVAFGPILGFDLGNGAMLYTTGSGVGSASNLYRFAGGAWQAVPPGFASVYANKFVVFDDDGSGPIPPALWAFGGFTSAGGVSSGGVARWNGCAGVCYANCDASAAAPVLNIQDFICFRDRFAAGDPAANCDQSVLPPVLNVADFVCFMNRYAVGCP